MPVGCVICSLQLSDANCLEVKDSKGIDALLSVAKLVAFMIGGLKLETLSERRLYVKDTGWVPYVPPPASWRFSDTIMRCVCG